MGLFDSYQFSPQAYEGQQGGLLDLIRSMQQAPQPAQQQPANYFQPQQQQPTGEAQLPPTAQPTQGQLMQPPQQRPPEAPGGLRAGFEGFIRNAHTGPIGAILGGVGSAMGMDDGNNVTVRALMSRGLDRDTARAAAKNPTLMSQLVPQLFGTKSGTVINNRLVNPATGQLIADFSDTKAPETKEFETAGGGKVAMQFNVKSGKWEPVPGIQGGGAGKPPAGYDWVDANDPKKGVAAIPGGPATHLPSETAGRIAMMDVGAEALPQARKVLMANRGPMGLKGLDGMASTTGIGEVGRAERSITTAIEGALRAMTGAAAPESEVKRYEGMFKPGPLDSVETATQKLNQLQDFIDGAKRLVNQGRGPAGNQHPNKPSDPLGIR